MFQRLTVILLPLAENGYAINFAIRNMLVSALKSNSLFFFPFNFYSVDLSVCRTKHLELLLYHPHIY